MGDLETVDYILMGWGIFVWAFMLADIAINGGRR